MNMFRIDEKHIMEFTHERLIICQILWYKLLSVDILAYVFESYGTHLLDM